MNQLPDTDPTPSLGARARAALTMAWASFLAAALATMLCFAVVDPDSFASGELPAWWTSRRAVYAVGFFFFWLVSFVAAALTWFLAPAARER